MTIVKNKVKSNFKKEYFYTLYKKMHSFVQNQSLLKNEFKLSGGSTTNYYFDIKKASLNGEFLSLCSDYILDYLLPKNKITPNLVGGITMGADFLTAALILKSYEKKLSITQGSIVRKEPKNHGTRNLIENDMSEITNNNQKKNILVIEDVVTSGKSLEKAVNIFMQSGYNTVGLLTIVDREIGGCEYLEQRFSLPVLSIFKSSDFFI